MSAWRSKVTSYDRIITLIWTLIFGICGVIGYLKDNIWLMVIGGLGVLCYSRVYYIISVSRPKITPLHLAIENNTWSNAEVMGLIQGGANVNAKDPHGNTPIHIAARCNEYKIIELLSNAGADVNAKNNIGNTPLHWAAAHHNYEAIEMLISYGADINLKNDYGLAPCLTDILKDKD